MQIKTSDLSYASIARTAWGRTMIRTVENLTGRPRVLWRMRDLPGRLEAGEQVWQVLPDLFNIRINRIGPPVPASGPLLVICNHPYGLADSLALCTLLAESGQPFRVVANDIFSKAGPIADHILPISFATGRQAARANLDTRRRARAALDRGEIVAMFPAGSTAGPPRPFAPPAEAPWSSFSARVALEADVPVLPVFMPMVRRPVFDTIGYLHPELRHALQIAGFSRWIDRTVDIHVGTPMRISDLVDAPSPGVAEMTTALRRAVLGLSPTPIDPEIEGKRF